MANETVASPVIQSIIQPAAAQPVAPASTAAKMSNFTKYQAWKWVGSMFMETKTDPATGEQHLAMGLTRIMALALFVAMMVLWLTKTEIVDSTQVPGLKVLLDPIPNSMLYTLGGLLGLKGVNTVTDAVKAAKTGGSETV